MHGQCNQPNKNEIAIIRMWLCREPNAGIKDKLKKNSSQTSPSHSKDPHPVVFPGMVGRPPLKPCCSGDLCTGVFTIKILNTNNNLSYCNGLNVCVPTKFLCGNSNSNVMVFGSGTLGR